MKEMVEIKKIDKEDNNEEDKISDEDIKFLEKLNFDKLTEENKIIIKDKKYYKEKLKNFAKHKLWIYILFFLVYLLYFLSLEKCYEGEAKCTTKFDWILRKIIEEVISCLIMSLIIQFMIFKKISKLHLIHFISIFVIIYQYDYGKNFDSHGYYNFIFYFIAVGLSTFILFPFDLIVFFSKDKTRIILLIGYLCFFLFIIYILLFQTAKCSNWTKGLNETYIDYDDTKYGCEIVIPNTCAYKIMSPFQDNTKIQRKNCTLLNNKKMKQNLLLKSKSNYINTNSSCIGYPLTNKDPICFLDIVNRGSGFINNYVEENLVDMENKEILDNYFKEKIPEVYIDFKNNDLGKIIIDVKYNETLSKERKLLEKNANPYSDNILYLFIDSVSRANALRQLKKTTKFVEKFMSYKRDNENDPRGNFHSFQFFKYHAFCGYTTINYPFLIFGQQAENSNKIMITKFLREKGFITSNAHDACRIDNTRSFHNYTNEELFDHQFVICDPNNGDINSNTIRCLYNKQNFEHMIDYSEQFWRKYSKNRKFSLISSNYGHEGTLNVIKYIDNYIADFLNRLYNDNLLKDSSIILISDHGVGMPSIYYLFDFYNIEIHLPALFLIINDRKNVTYEEQYKHMHDNQQTLITPLDVYNTLGNIIYGEQYTDVKNKTLENDTLKNQLGISLFDFINPKERQPNKFNNYSEISLGICR